MNMQNNDVRNKWVKGPSYREDTTFTELFAQKIVDKKGLNNTRAHLQNKSGFLKYNHSLLVNTVQ